MTNITSAAARFPQLLLDIGKKSPTIPPNAGTTATNSDELLSPL